MPTGTIVCSYLTVTLPNIHVHNSLRKTRLASKVRDRLLLAAHGGRDVL